MDRIGVMTQEENMYYYYIAILDWIGVVTLEENMYYYYIAILDRIGVVTQEENSLLLDSSVGSDWCCDTRR